MGDAVVYGSSAKCDQSLDFLRRNVINTADLRSVHNSKVVRKFNNNNRYLMYGSKNNNFPVLYILIFKDESLIRFKNSFVH